MSAKVIYVTSGPKILNTGIGTKLPNNRGEFDRYADSPSWGLRAGTRLCAITRQKYKKKVSVRIVSGSE